MKKGSVSQPLIPHGSKKSCKVYKRRPRAALGEVCQRENHLLSSSASPPPFLLKRRTFASAMWMRIPLSSSPRGGTSRQASRNLVTVLTLSAHASVADSPLIPNKVSIASAFATQYNTGSQGRQLEVATLSRAITSTLAFFIFMLN